MTNVVRSDLLLQREFVDLSEPQPVEYARGKRYVMPINDLYSRLAGRAS